jgi:hypothetical protein
MTANVATRDKAPGEGVREIDQCSKCATRIGLQAPSTSAPASAWLCCRCGSCYFARCQDSDGLEPASGVRPVSYYEVMKAIYVHMEGDSCPMLYKEVARPTRSAERKYTGPESRKQKRYPCPAKVTIIPLGRDFRIAAQPARVVTTNLSGGGVAMVHARPVTQPYLAVDFAASGIDLLPAIVEVTRVRHLAAGYEIAGKLISRILH